MATSKQKTAKLLIGIVMKTNSNYSIISEVSKTQNPFGAEKTNRAKQVEAKNRKLEAAHD